MKKLWQKHGGRQHGPHVEQYFIEEMAFYRFARDLCETTLAIQPEALLAASSGEREKALEAALGKAVVFTAYRKDDPMTLSFKFTTEQDRLDAANAFDDFLRVEMPCDG